MKLFMYSQYKEKQREREMISYIYRYMYTSQSRDQASDTPRTVVMDGKS
jgi:hypothetical protein